MFRNKILRLVLLIAPLVGCGPQVPPSVSEFYRAAMRGPVPSDLCVRSGGVIISLALIDFGPGAFRDARPKGLPYQFKYVGELKQGLIEIEDDAGRRYLAIGYGEAGPASGATQAHHVSTCVWSAP